jgi:predicted small secreted protein
VYEILKIYQGGGTTLHLDDFEQYMRRIDGNEKDCILITDVGLDNISEVIDYFSKLKNRLTIIWIKSDVKDYEIFQKSYKLLKEGLPFVTFVEVEDERDIPRIAVGKSFGEVYAR